jgi:hypothetical protein
MTQRVVRVRVPVVHEYDVVFEDGRPLFVGAVIPREASKKGPNAGKIVETHRTTWDGRGGGAEYLFHEGRPLGLSGELVEAAMKAMDRDPEAGSAGRVPAQLGRPYKKVQVGRH